MASVYERVWGYPLASADAITRCQSRVAPS